MLQIPQLTMESTRGKIELNTTRPVQEIRQRAADMTIEQRPAELQIQRTPGMLTIDQTKAREDVDLKSVFKRTEEATQIGYSDWLEGIARVAQQGDELMMIEIGGNPLAAQAAENSASRIYEFNIGFIPSSNRVKIDFQPARVNIDWQVNKPEINVVQNKPEHVYTPGLVLIQMKQWPSLKIDITG